MRNEYGQSQSKCRLNVNAIETGAKNSPNFIELLKDINVIEGHDICFKCRVSGQPQPLLKWYKNGVEIEETSRIKVRHI